MQAAAVGLAVGLLERGGLGTAVPTELCIWQDCVNGGWMSVASTSSPGYVPKLMKALYLPAELLQQGIWGELYMPPYPPSHIPILHPDLRSLGLDVPSFNQNFITDQRHLFTNKLCQNKYIPIIWKSPKCLISRKRHKKKKKQRPDVNEIWIAVFKAWNWQWYLKPENDTHVARGSGDLLSLWDGMFHSINTFLFWFAHTTSLFITGATRNVPMSDTFPVLVVISTSSPSLQRSVFQQPLEMFTSILFTRDKMLIPRHFRWWGEKERKEGRETSVICSFIIPQCMGSHLFTWLTCLDLITTHS